MLPDSQTQWIESLPPAAQPYARLMRLDRPIGIWLLFLPCAWGALLASLAAQTGRFPFGTLVLFALGAVVMRGAGCVWNDILDRDIDVQVERTRLRPLASGVLRERDALVFLAILLLVGLLIVLQFNGYTLGLGCLALALVAAYPFAKRATHFPQVVLGFAFSFGVLMGWSAVLGSLHPIAVLFYAAAVFWTVGYDTIYALQDVADDEAAGVKSTARFFGARAPYFIIICYTLSVTFALFAVLLARAGLPSLFGLMGYAAMLSRQFMTLDAGEEGGALAAFRANRDAGLCLAAGLVVDVLLAR